MVDKRSLVVAFALVALVGCTSVPTSSPTGTPATTPSASLQVSGLVTAQPSQLASGSVAPSESASQSMIVSPVPTATRTTTPPPSTPRPTRRPVSTPRPGPTPRPTANPTPLAPSRLVSHGSRSETAVALTFDMGGRVGDAVAIVEWLASHDVHASIFMTGAMAASSATDAGRQVLAIIDRHPDLFTLGNHSYTHRDFRTLTATDITTELRRTEAAVAPYCAENPRPFFRPPYGGWDSRVLAAVGAAGYPMTVTWDVDTIDWRPVANDPPGPTAAEIVTKVIGRAQAGSIVLMHLGGYETFTALPGVVTGLLERGYDLVTLDELLG